MRLTLNFILGNFAVIRNTQQKIIPQVTKHWSLSVEINASGIIPGWSNILRVGPGVNDAGAYGDRAPAIFFHPSTTRLHITNAVNGDKNYIYDHSAQLQINQWYKIDVGQSLHADGYHYIIAIDGNVVKDIINHQPQEFRNNKVSSS